MIRFAFGMSSNQIFYCNSLLKKLVSLIKYSMSKKNEKRVITPAIFEKSFTIAAGTILGGGILASCTKDPEYTETGDKVKVLTADGQLMEVDRGHALCCNVPTSKDVRKGIPGRHFVMVIDLSRCRNARACVHACNKMHFLQPGHEWMKVFLMQDSEDTSPY